MLFTHTVWGSQLAIPTKFTSSFRPTHDPGNRLRITSVIKVEVIVVVRLVVVFFTRGGENALHAQCVVLATCHSH